MEQEFYDYLRIKLLQYTTGFDVNIENLEKVEERYRQLEQNSKIQKLTKDIEDILYDYTTDLMPDFLDKFLNEHFMKNKLKELEPLVISEINKNVFRSINEIVKFKDFQMINEKMDIFNLNLDLLLRSKEGWGLLTKVINNTDGISIYNAVLNGYKIEIVGDKYLPLFKKWKEQTGIDYETDRVTNKEHEDYGKNFYTIRLFKDPFLPHVDISNVMKQINGNYEKSDIFNINLSELTNTKEGWELLINTINNSKDIEIKETGDNSYMITAIGQEYLPLFEKWKSEFGKNWEFITSYISNKDNKDFGKPVYLVEIYRRMKLR